jgi:predicted transcriptional regulator
MSKPKEQKSPFPTQLKSERKRLGLTQKGLAEKIDTTETTIARWERGDSTPLPVFEKAILTMLSVFPGHE